MLVNKTFRGFYEFIMTHNPETDHLENNHVMDKLIKINEGYVKTGKTTKFIVFDYPGDDIMYQIYHDWNDDYIPCTNIKFYRIINNQEKQFLMLLQYKMDDKTVSIFIDDMKSNKLFNSDNLFGQVAAQIPWSTPLMEFQPDSDKNFPFNDGKYNNIIKLNKNKISQIWYDKLLYWMNWKAIFVYEKIFNGCDTDINIIKGAKYHHINGKFRLIGGEIIKHIPLTRYIEPRFTYEENDDIYGIPIREMKIEGSSINNQWEDFNYFDIVILSWDYINNVNRITLGAKGKIYLPMNTYGLGDPVWNPTGEKIIGYTCLIQVNIN